MLKISISYLEKQKSFIPKKSIFLAVPPRYIQKMALAISIFQKVLMQTTKVRNLGKHYIRLTEFDENLSQWS